MEKQKYRGIIFTDLDGTLLFHKKNQLGEAIYDVSQTDLEAIKKLRANGYIIVIATGRDLMGIRRFLQQAKIAFDFYVGNNGSLILDQFFKPLYKEYIEETILKNVMLHVKNLYKNTGMFGTDGYKRYYFEQYYSNDQVGNAFEDAIFLTYDSFITKPFPLTMVNVHMVDNQKGNSLEQLNMAKKIEQQLKKNFSDQVNIFRNQNFVDLAPLSCSKGNAVQYIVHLLKMDMEHTYVIGDSWNDVSMFETSATSFSFHHAEKEVQGKAKYVVKSFAQMAEKLDLL